MEHPAEWGIMTNRERAKWEKEHPEPAPAPDPSRQPSEHKKPLTAEEQAAEAASGAGGYFRKR